MPPIVIPVWMGSCAQYGVGGGGGGSGSGGVGGGGGGPQVLHLTGMPQQTVPTERQQSAAVDGCHQIWQR
jgi:hypothetical protein